MAQKKSDILESLISQLEKKQADISCFLDLIDDYMALYDIKKKLKTDIKKRGVSYEAQSASGKATIIKQNQSVKDLVAVNKQMLELHINSNGGSVKEGVAIYSQLKQKNCKKVGYVDGVAYSVAFLILQACDERVMGLGTSALIHNMWMSVDGNAKELRKAADDLDTLMESNRQIFLEKSNLEEQQLIDMMEAETFLTPEKALEYGLIDRVDSYQADDKDVQQRLMSRVQQLSGVIAQQKSFREQLESMRQQGGEPKPPVPTPKPEPEEKKLTNQLAKLFQNM